MSPQLDRRRFIQLSASTGAGLVIGVVLPGCTEESGPTTTTAAPTPTSPPPTPTTDGPTTTTTPTQPPDPDSWWEPSIYLTIDDTGGVTVTAFRSELGQGVRTAIAMIIAEELDADWSSVRVVQAPADPRFGDQVTGGSVSISRSYQTLRQAGAAARQALRETAAAAWSVDPGICSTERGTVVNPHTGEVLRYGDLVEAAAARELPRNVDLREPAAFRIIGKATDLIDAPGHVDGSVVYGFDVRVPGMQHAVMARSPVFGGRLRSYDAAEARLVPGVTDVVEVSDGVAVVGYHTWAVIEGRARLEVEWSGGSDVDTESIMEDLRRRAGTAGPATGSRLEAVYEVPFYAHAPMEPLACVADVRPDHCEVWAPTQDPQAARRAAAAAAGLDSDRVTVHVTAIGGGFGRRLQADFVREAVELSAKTRQPVKLMWTREDDLHHDFYQPACVYHVSGDFVRPDRIDLRPYRARGAVPTGPWRAVNNVPDAFVRESFLDELADAAGVDPYEMRLSIVPHRERACLELAARQAGWNSPLPAGWGRGIAHHSTWEATPVTQVVEVSVGTGGTVSVHRVVCAVDCGTPVNPDTIEAQMEGGIVFGLSAALRGSITIDRGGTVESNFDDYPILRLDEMPEIEVSIVPSRDDPTGIGEMGVPPIAPALANAIFSATGKRIRHLPITAVDLTA